MKVSFLFFFFMPLLLNFLLVPLAARFAALRGLVDKPGHRKIHPHPVPHIGGAAIVFSVLISLGAGLLLVPPDFTADQVFRLGWVLVFTLAAFLQGFLDDLYDLRPRTKLLFQCLLTGAFSMLGYHFTLLHVPGTAPLDLSLWGIPLTMVWMMAVLNGFNFVDGIDGLAGSISVVSLLGMCFICLFTGSSALLVICLAFLGAVLAFLFYNWRPAKVYLGDAGSNALGMFLAAGLVSLGNDRGFLFQSPPPVLDGREVFRFQMLTASLLVGYPLMEITLSTFRRATKRFFYGRSLEWSEREHIHHQLLKLGLKSGRICWITAVFQLVLAAAALLAVVRQNALAIWLLVPIFMVLAYFMPRLGLLDFLGAASIQQRPHFSVANFFVSMQGVKLRLAQTREEILVLVGQTCREFGVYSCRMFLRPDGEKRGGLDYKREWDQERSPEHLGFIKPSPDDRREGFADSFSLPDSGGSAHWVFAPHLADDDLEVEYRVLVREFMREALEKSRNLGRGLSNLQVLGTSPLDHKNVRGHMLRKRQHAKKK